MRAQIALRRADAQDAEYLTELRKTVLIAANSLDPGTDLRCIEAACIAYFADEARQTTFLALDGERIVGVGTVIPMTSCLRFPTRRAAARFS